MAATTKARTTTKVRQGGKQTFPIAANTKINGGSMVATNAAGFAVPASADATLTIWGKADRTVDNLGGAAGAKNVVAELSAGEKDFLYDNGATVIDAADVGKNCYVDDDQTVSMDNVAKPVAGTVMGVTTAGVFVRFKH